MGGCVDLVKVCGCVDLVKRCVLTLVDYILRCTNYRHYYYYYTQSVAFVPLTACPVSVMFVPLTACPVSVMFVPLSLSSVNDICPTKSLS